MMKPSFKTIGMLSENQNFRRKKSCWRHSILGMVSANESRCYIVMSALIVWAQIHNDPYIVIFLWW